ncbi:Gfo/Idh/MocA family protein [Streptomyces sp. NBC_00448]|uniref:Gfo/Idh/MocA family protein n=1 Tax=Streptomyces sp. NBC_00448 TaxID=2903652 RepID=UPI002E22214B
MAPIPVVLAGAHGHGHRHLDNLRRLTVSGTVVLTAVCDLRPLHRSASDGLGTPLQGSDLGALIDRTGARVAIICTPIHTHADLALAAADHGAHVLLEKPPAPSYGEFERLVRGLDSTGTACQIGFQSLGSHAVPRIRRLMADGAIGEVRGIGAAGNWVREEHYFRRADWSGRRALHGIDVVDGVLTNPLAHAVATALRLDGSDRAEDVADIETELFRAHAIESDDTACVRIRTVRRTRVTVAATLCARAAAEPYVVVHGTRGRITFWYRRDQVLVERAGQAPDERVFGRTDLLENLLAHLADGTDLLVPPATAGAFMKVVEAVRTAPDPAAIPAALWQQAPGEHSRRRVIEGVDAMVDAAARSLKSFSALGAPWTAAAPPSEAHPR